MEPTIGAAGWANVGGSHRRVLPLPFKLNQHRRQRTDRGRATEVNVAVHMLNRMVELGCPTSVRTA